MFERTFSGVLGPHFAQLKQIGGGGSGSVYSGVDTRFDFPVCIKRLSVTNKDECRAALREIRIRRRLRHENIVGLLNAITSDGTDVNEIAPANFRDTSCIYLVQELLDADLRQVIESNSRLTDDYVKLFFYQLLRGVKYIHSANVLHRDLKPSNVMINVNSLELMIGDFGHSIVLDPDYSHSNCQSSCDTSLWYKAPELIVGSSRYSTSSDMWAVGCILAEMLLGRPLFEGENDLEQLELIIHTIEINERDQVSVRQCLTDKVNKMYTGRPKFPLQSKFQKVDSQALHLLERLLSFNASDRVTTEQALNHPFLHEYSCAGDEPECLKPLHLEHEVDDFLEYTLKDLIVGECVALAEEQPRIHMQMSSYSSLMDIVKELNTSRSAEPLPQSVEDGKNGGITIKVSCDNEREGGDGSRFKVLEVLKEEHTSSSDSNGIQSHEDGISEEPLISDHPTFSSLKWENERHKFGHRRHHSHHRKKPTAGDDGSRSRKRKISPGNKTHKSPISEREVSPGLLPDGLISGSMSSNLSSSNESRSSPSKLIVEESDSIPGERLVIDEDNQDGKVNELISQSDQLIAGYSNHLCENSASGNELDVHESETVEHPGSVLSSGLSIEDKHFGLRDSKEYIEHSANLSSVAEVLIRSRELLDEASVDEVKEQSLLDGDLGDSVQDLILKSEQLLSCRGKEEREQINDSYRVSHHTLRDLAENPPLLNAKGKTLNDGELNDPVNYLLLKSEQLLKPEVKEATKHISGCALEDPANDLILKSEQLPSSQCMKIEVKTVGKKEQEETNTSDRISSHNTLRNLTEDAPPPNAPPPNAPPPNAILFLRERESNDPVKNLIMKSEQLLSSREKGKLETIPDKQELARSSIACSISDHKVENAPPFLEQRRRLVDGELNDPVKDFILKSRRQENMDTREQTAVDSRGEDVQQTLSKSNTLFPRELNDPMKDLTSASEKLRWHRGEKIGQESVEKIGQESVDKRGQVDHSQPTHSVEHTLEAMLSDPFHLRESNRRMQELFKESHTLLSNLINDPDGTIRDVVQPYGGKLSSPKNELAGVEALAVESESGKHNSDIVSKRTDHDSFSVTQFSSPPVSQNAFRTSVRDVTALEKDFDLDEMRAVLEKAKQTLDQDGGSSKESCQPTVPRATESKSKENKPTNKPIVQQKTKSEVRRLATVKIFRRQNLCSFCHVSPQDTPEVVMERPALLEPITVNYTPGPMNPTLLKNTVVRPPRNLTANLAKHSGSTGDGSYSCAADSGFTDLAIARGIPVNISGAKSARDYNEEIVVERIRDIRDVFVKLTEINTVAATQVEEDPRGPGVDKDGQRVFDETSANKADNGEARNVMQEQVTENRERVNASALGKTSEVCNRFQEDPKQTLNGLNYGQKTSVGKKNDEERTHVAKMHETHCNGVYDSLDTRYRVETANEADLSERALKCRTNYALQLPHTKQCEEFETSVGRYHTGTGPSNTITTKFNSEDLVGKLYCGGTDKNPKVSNTGLHSKDSTGLRSFYNSIKIKSLMNRSRTYRDKLY